MKEPLVGRGLVHSPFVNIVFMKHKRASYKSHVHNPKGILYFIHSNLRGLTKKTFLGGCNYVLKCIGVKYSIYEYLMLIQ